MKITPLRFSLIASSVNFGIGMLALLFQLQPLILGVSFAFLAIVICILVWSIIIMLRPRKPEVFGDKQA